jgi:hypothetical protein
MAVPHRMPPLLHGRLISLIIPAHRYAGRTFTKSLQPAKSVKEIFSWI